MNDKIHGLIKPRVKTPARSGRRQLKDKIHGLIKPGKVRIRIKESKIRRLNR